MPREGTLSARALGIGVSLLALTVGGLVAVLSAVSGSGSCSVYSGAPGLPPEPPDAVCYQLVRTMAERVGVVTAVATAVVVLTMVGLSRMARGPVSRA